MSGTESHAQRVLSVLNQQRTLGQLCDAALSPSEGLVRLAHRNVLACFSDMFQDMPNAQDNMVIALDDCSEEGLELLLDFIYTGELHLDNDNCHKVELAATSLYVPDVIAMCQQFNKSPEAETVKGKRGRPKKSAASDNNDDKVKGRVTITANENQFGNTEESQVAAGGKKGVNKSEHGQEKGQSLLLLIEEVVVPDCEQPPGKLEPPSGLSHPDHTAPIGYNDDNDDFGDFGENSLDSWDHADPETPAAIPEKKRRKNPTTSAKKKEGRSVDEDEKGEGGRVQCPLCNKSFKSKYYLKVHDRRHTGEKPYGCDKCGKRYFRNENLKEHMARNCAVTAKTFECRECSEMFTRKSQLSSHMVTHTGVMPFQCPVCPEQFMQKKPLDHHMVKLHGFPKPHACPECSKTFMSKTELRIHDMSKHKGEKPFVCEECGLQATSRNGLKTHIRAIHRKQKPFVCTECGHAFSQKNNLNMHMLVHTGERPYQCHQCGKTFRTQGTLDKHNRVHTGERPFSCPDCQQRFTEKGAMLRHMESKHQEGRPYTCCICGRSFKGRELLRVHLNRHKGERKFECKDCGYKFTRQAHLRRHSLVHKRNEHYSPKQRKIRNIIVGDDLDNTTDSIRSAQIVQELLKKKSKAAKKKSKSSKKSKKAKTKKPKDGVEGVDDSLADLNDPECNESKEKKQKKKMKTGKKKEEVLLKTEVLESTVDMTEIMEEKVEPKLD